MQTLQVLVVDDEAGMRHSVARALRDHTIRLSNVDQEVRFEVNSAASGEEALTRIEAQVPDILLLDHQLGGITGIDVLKRLAATGRDLLTIMITAFATIETAVRATKCGAFDFLAKPFTPDELKDTIRKAAAHLMVQREARRLAAEKRRVRFEFISVLAHELKSPLGVVETYLSILSGRPNGNDLSAYEDIVKRCQARMEGMRKLIEDLLDLTRIESGERQRELRRVDLVAVARSAMEALAPAAAARRVTMNLASDAAATMTADQGEVEIVLNNLLSNAIKYNREDGRVDVRIAADEASVTLEVTDTGIGLAPEETSQLFSEFVRIKNERTHGIPGSGLGLSTVRKIAQLYDGTVGVRSQPDAGSTFTVVLRRPAQEGTDATGRDHPLAARA
jgi:two-component system, sensor histidine kinase and response regulator